LKALLSKIPFRAVYILLFCAVGVGLLWSRALLSISVGALFGFWVIEGGLAYKLKTIITKKHALAFTSLFIIPLLGMLYTDNYLYGMRMLSIYLPFIVMPLVAGTISPFNEKEFKFIFYLLLVSTVLNTIYNMAVFYSDFDPSRDYREMSRFISHIRYSLIIVLMVVGDLFIIKTFKNNKAERVFLIAAAVWLILFLFLLQAFSGIVIFIALCFYYLILYLKRLRPIYSVTLLTLVLLISFALSSYIYSDIVKPFVYPPKLSGNLPLKTANGNLYSHDTNNTMLENGNYVGLYVCREEMSETWPLRSSIDLDGKCRNGYGVFSVAARYLTSKGLTKDKEGVLALTDEDILAIEDGVTNVRFLNHVNPLNRLYIIVWELAGFFNGMSPKGHSVPQRFEFLKVAVHTFKKDPIFGVGTGDLYDELYDSYDEVGSQLSKHERREPHNQFMTWAVAYGAVGCFILLFLFSYSFWGGSVARSCWGISLYILLILSFFNEDTFNTQAGACMSSFFYAIYVLVLPKSPVIK